MRTPHRIARISGRATAMAGVVALVVTLGAAPATAGSQSGQRLCSSNYSVDTQSFSSGFTSHRHDLVGSSKYQGATWNNDYGRWRGYRSYGWNKVDWRVYASVLETAYSRCLQDPS